MSEKKGFMGADEIPTGENGSVIEKPQFPPTQESEQQVGSSVLGLTEEEETDVNNIVVTVNDPSPVVVLFGARTSGKTMTLIRLTQYLEAQGYQIKPDPIFRPANDAHYKKMCNNYLKLCHGKYAPSGTDAISFMLVKVLDKIGRPICQLLEAPGEHYFDPADPKKQFPTYITNILKLRNRRTWMFIVEQDWGGEQEIRDMYVARIKNMPATIKRDKIIFTCHKVDEHPELTLANGMPNTPQIFKNLINQYPGIFDNFKNTNPILRLFQKYNFAFIPFSAGAFTPTESGKQVYTPGEDVYPRMLWKAILKTVKG